MKKLWKIALEIYFLFALLGCAQILNENNKESDKKLVEAVGLDVSVKKDTDSKSGNSGENKDSSELTGKSIPDDKYTLCYGTYYTAEYSTTSYRRGVVGFMFHATVGKEYVIFWNDKSDGSDAFNSTNNGADIKVRADAWNDSSYDKELFDYIDNGYSEGKEISVSSDCDVVLYAEILNSGFFGITAVEKDTRLVIELKRASELNVVSDAPLSLYENDDNALATNNWTSGELNSEEDLSYSLSINSNSLYRICYECSAGDLDFEVVQPASDNQLCLYRRNGLCIFEPKCNNGTFVSGTVYLKIYLRAAVSADYKIVVLDKGVYKKYNESYSQFVTEPVTLTKIQQTRTFTIGSVDLQYLDFSSYDNVTLKLTSLANSSELNTLIQKMKASNAEFILDLENYTGSVSFGDVVGESAFAKTNLAAVILRPVSSHKRNLFRNCTSLKEVTILASEGNSDYGDNFICSGAFWGCTNLESVKISNSVQVIGENAFQDCINLKSIVIPAFVTNIGAYAFANCKSLTSIKIPSSVTNIFDHAFEGCSSLKSIAFEKTYGWYRYSFEVNSGKEFSTDLSDSEKNVNWFTKDIWLTYMWETKI